MHRHDRLRPLVCAALVALLMSSIAGSERASAQVLPAALGFVGGFIGGTYVTTGVLVFKSRATGWTLHGTEDVLAVRPELLPMVITPIAAAIIGYNEPSRLAAAGTWGGVGLLGGAVLGAGFGHLIWGTNEGRWAGGTIGSAAGLAIGAVLGGLSYRKDEEDGGGGGVRAPFVSFSIPVGGW